MSRQFKNVVIATGPTGGHFFPALTVCRSLKQLEPQANVHLVANRLPRFFEPTDFKSVIQFHVIPCGVPGKNLFSFNGINSLLQYAVAFFRAFVLLLKLKPDVVAGFGSYGSVPIVVSAFILKIPVLLHEQNVAAGRANQLLSRLADTVAVSFPDPTSEFPAEKVFVSGYPLRPEFCAKVQADPCNKPTDDLFRILIFGGSQGAQRINDVFLGAMAMINSEERSKIAVIHIVGPKDIDVYVRRYYELGIRSEVFGFSDRVSEHLQRSELVVSRAGAGTIFELAAVGRSAILVPYPHANAHQALNAKYLSDRQMAVTIDEAHMSEKFLSDTVVRLKYDKNLRHAFKTRIQTLTTQNASEVVARKLVQLAKGDK